MCCVMGYTGHDLSAEKFKEYLLRTVDRGPDDQRVVEGPEGSVLYGLCRHCAQNAAPSVAEEQPAKKCACCVDTDKNP